MTEENMVQDTPEVSNAPNSPQKSDNKVVAFLDKLFKLKVNKTRIGTEILAGVTTFFAMAYIIFVNPSFLQFAGEGMHAGAVLLATCLATAVGCFLMAFIANLPYGMAPGMGLNAFFAFTVCGSMGFSWRAGLAAVFISGLIFIVLTVTGAREAIVKAIPTSLKKAIGAGIGLFIAYIGFFNVDMIDVSAGVPAIAFNPAAILMLVGLVLTVALLVLKVKGAIFIGIIGTTLIGLLLGLISGDYAQFGIFLPDSFKFDFGGFETFGGMFAGFGELFASSDGFGAVLLSVLTVLIALTLVDMFDTIGTLIGTATRAGMIDEEGNPINGKQAMLADAIATSVGALLGTSTVTTYVESGTGIEEGGRTGLTAFVIGFLFLVSILVAPIMGVVPSAATAPALIVVGVMMMSAVKDIEWLDLTAAIPAFLCVLSMPIFYSISDGIALGCISFVLIRLVLWVKALITKSNEPLDVHPIMFIVTGLFLLRFILLAI